MKIHCGTLIRFKRRPEHLHCVLLYRHSGKKWFKITAIDLETSRIVRMNCKGQIVEWIDKVGTMDFTELLVHSNETIRCTAASFVRNSRQVPEPTHFL